MVAAISLDVINDFRKKDFFNKVVRYKNQNSFLQFLNDYSYKTTYEAICRSFHYAKLDSKSECSLRLYWLYESGRMVAGSRSEDAC